MKTNRRPESRAFHKKYYHTGLFILENTPALRLSKDALDTGYSDSSSSTSSVDSYCFALGRILARSTTSIALYAGLLKFSVCVCVSVGYTRACIFVWSTTFGNGICDDTKPRP